MTGREPGLPDERKGGPTCTCLAQRQNFDSVVDPGGHSFAQSVQVFSVPDRRGTFHRVQAIEDGFLHLGVSRPKAVGQQNSRLPPRGATR